MLYVSEQGKLYILMDYCDGGNSFWVMCVMVLTYFYFTDQTMTPALGRTELNGMGLFNC